MVMMAGISEEQKKKDFQMMLACSTHLGTKNLDYQMSRYVWKRKPDGIHIINLTFWVGAYGFADTTGYAIFGTVGAGIILTTILVSCIGTQKAAMNIPPPSEPFRFNGKAGTIETSRASVPLRPSVFTRKIRHESPRTPLRRWA